MFKDGNKRVANLIANKEMIKYGQGIISIPVEKIGEYLTRLIEYYETNDVSELKNWIYDNCVDGVQNMKFCHENGIKGIQMIFCLKNVAFIEAICYNYLTRDCVL